MFEFLKRKKEAPEKRSFIVNDSGLSFADYIGSTAANVTVNRETALGIPALWAAVNFLSGTLAGLPLHVYDKSGGKRTKLSGGVSDLLHYAVNDELSSFQWRKNVFESVLTTGRGATYIERDALGRVTNLFPLETSRLTVKIKGGEKFYEYRNLNEVVRYKPSQIIDLVFMLKPDGFSHYSPILKNRDVLALAIAATNYGNRIFHHGGVPSFAILSNAQSAEGVKRSSDSFRDAISKAANEGRHALVLPAGHDIKPIGSDAQKNQLLELKRFCIEEVARIFSLPPVFLQDLSRSTFSNAEQQDLHFTKHTIKRWVEQFEQEVNLKLFGRDNNDVYCEFSLDGLLRGDFSTRMSGYATGIQHALITPNEARELENRQPLDAGDNLLIQGATIPLAGGNINGQ